MRTRASQVRSEAPRTDSDRLLLAVTVACALGALAMLGRWAFATGLWCDELLFLRAIEAGPVGGLMLAGSSHPPLVRWILTPFVSSATSDLGLRALSLAASVACVFVWSALLRRILVDRVLVCLVLPACVLNAAWAAVAFQLVPYACFSLFVALHAWRLAFLHPRTQKLRQFEAPMPADFRALLDQLRGSA